MRDEPKNVRANLVKNVTAINFRIFFGGLIFDIKAAGNHSREDYKSSRARVRAAVVHSWLYRPLEYSSQANVHMCLLSVEGGRAGTRMGHIETSEEPYYGNSSWAQTKM